MGITLLLYFKVIFQASTPLLFALPLLYTEHSLDNTVVSGQTYGIGSVISPVLYLRKMTSTSPIRGVCWKVVEPRIKFKQSGSTAQS